MAFGSGVLYIACRPSVLSAQSSLPSPDDLVSSAAPLVTTSESPPKSLSLGQRIRQWARICWRCSYLLYLSTPVIISYPLCLLSPGWKRWWLDLCLSSVQSGGALLVKMAQWASSRPDLFGEEFCHTFCKLQDKTQPHPWKDTEATLRADLGPDWQDRLQLDKQPIGSGSVAQVYRGTMLQDSTNPWGNTVAVKILHPNVAETIEMDLGLMKRVAWMLCQLPFGVGERLDWMNIVGMVEEFGSLLEGQLDLRTEAENLARFNRTFSKHEYGVRFPRRVDSFEPTRNVLVEEFIEGVPVMQWVHTHKEFAKERQQFSRRGIQSVCKMIFQDNFLHGDLHPGNVMVSNEGEIVMLDVGITKVFSKSDHDLLVNVLTCFIRSNGREAAVHMAENSDTRMGSASNPEDVALFAEKIQAMVTRAKTDDSFFASLGDYFTTICDAASMHRVKMNQGFVTMALAVKVMEGIALELDPKIEVWSVANPIILQNTASRKWSEAIHEVLNFWLPDLAHTSRWSASIKNLLR